MTNLVHNNLFNVRATGLKPGDPKLVLREPTVGKWYVGIEILDDDVHRHCTLARYEGEGNWSDDDLGEEDIDMLGYDYLQEQL